MILVRRDVELEKLRALQCSHLLHFRIFTFFASLSLVSPMSYPSHIVHVVVSFPTISKQFSRPLRSDAKARILVDQFFASFPSLPFTFVLFASLL